MGKRKRIKKHEYMIIEQQENEKAQKEAWLRAEKAELRKIAIQQAAYLKPTTAIQQIEDADKIYGWLIKELE